MTSRRADPPTPLFVTAMTFIAQLSVGVSVGLWLFGRTQEAKIAVLVAISILWFIFIAASTYALVAWLLKLAIRWFREKT